MRDTIYVIQNAVKNLAASTNIQRFTNLEILRSAQDDENNKWCVLHVESIDTQSLIRSDTHPNSLDSLNSLL